MSRRFSVALSIVLLVLAVIMAWKVTLPWYWGNAGPATGLQTVRGLDLADSSTYFGDSYGKFFGLTSDKDNETDDLSVGPRWTLLLAIAMAGCAVATMARPLQRLGSAAAVTTASVSLFSAEWAVILGPPWAEGIGVGLTIWLLSALAAVVVSIAMVVLTEYVTPFGDAAATVSAIAGPILAVTGYLCLLFLYGRGTTSAELANERNFGFVTAVVAFGLALACGLMALLARPREPGPLVGGVVAVALSGFVFVPLSAAVPGALS
jgi:hypothetical protein